MTCDPRRPSFAEVLRQPARALAAVVGVACIVGSVLVGSSLDASTLLLSAGGFLLLVGFAWSTVSAIELNSPLLKVSITAAERKRVMTDFFMSQRADLEVCAIELCDDPEIAKKALESAVAAAAAKWGGPADERLRLFLLCVMIRTVQHELTYHPPLQTVGESVVAPSQASPAIWFEQPILDRVILLLVEREGLASDLVGGMLDLPVDDVRARTATARQRMAGMGSGQ